jgi:hypothetical protein
MVIRGQLSQLPGSATHQIRLYKKITWGKEQEREKMREKLQDHTKRGRKIATLERKIGVQQKIERLILWETKV